MTTTSPVTLHAALEPASPGAAPSREREGILVPWDQPGRANIGPFGQPGTHGLMVRREFARTLTADAKLVGVYGHNRPGVDASSVSRVVALEDRPEGLWGRIRIGRTPLGDQLLAEIDDGIRDGLSVEVTDLQFDPTGHVVGGRLDYYAHVAVGAYSSARASALAASVTTPGASVTLPAPAPAPASAPVLQANLTSGVPAAPAPAAPVQVAAPAPAAPTPAPASTDALQALLAALSPAPAAPVQPAAPAAPAGGQDLAQLLAGLSQLQALANIGHGTPAGPPAATMLGTPGVPAAPGTTLVAEVDPLEEASRLAAQLHQSGGRDAGLYAALQDITASGLPLFQEESSRLGDKLWEGTADTSRPFVDLMAQGDLKAMKYYGWQWTELPEMEEWAGDKTTINGNPVDLEQVPFTAKRCAAGWDVDRKYKDFGDPEFWREFYTEQTRAYRRLSNKWASQALVAAALNLGTAANVPAGYADLIPSTGIPQGASQILKAAAIGRVILEATPRVEQGPDYVLVNPIDWLGLADLAAIDLPAFLALLKVDPAGFRPSIEVPRGRVIMGVKAAMKFRELPGSEGKGSPIRVEALDVARGGVDSAVFGYVGISVERPGGVVSVPLDDADGVTG